MVAYIPIGWYIYLTMNEQAAKNRRDKLIEASSELIRCNGYGPTTVEQICSHAGVTKGAFFHYFKSKEELAVAALQAWDQAVTHLFTSADYQQIEDPCEKVCGFLAFSQRVFSDPNTVRSCLAGTTVQEVAHSNEPIRRAANACFEHCLAHLTELIAAAAAHRGIDIDAKALSAMWTAAVQGALILYKASGDESHITNCLQQARLHIERQLSATESPPG